MNVWKAWNKFLAEQVTSKYEKTKTKNPRDHLAETANLPPDAMAQMGKQQKNIALNVEKETTLPIDVG